MPRRFSTAFLTTFGALVIVVVVGLVWRGRYWTGGVIGTHNTAATPVTPVRDGPVLPDLKLKKQPVPAKVFDDYRKCVTECGRERCRVETNVFKVTYCCPPDMTGYIAHGQIMCRVNGG
jgi:hypothetical protein